MGEAEVPAALVEGTRQPFLQRRPGPDDVGDLLDRLRVDLARLRIAHRILGGRLHQVKSGAPVEQLDDVGRVRRGGFELGEITPHRVHHALAFGIAGIEAEGGIQHPAAVGLPVDLPRHRGDPRGVGAMEENQRGQDGIVVVPIAPRAAAEGAGVGAGDAAAVDEEVDRGLPILLLPEVGADEEGVGQAGHSPAPEHFHAVASGGVGGLEAGKIADPTFHLAAEQRRFGIGRADHEGRAIGGPRRGEALGPRGLEADLVERHRMGLRHRRHGWRGDFPGRGRGEAEQRGGKGRDGFHDGPPSPLTARSAKKIVHSEHLGQALGIHALLAHQHEDPIALLPAGGGPFAAGDDVGLAVGREFARHVAALEDD